MKISIVGYSLMAVGIAPVLSETIHGVVVFIRHGDRTAKFFKGYEMTNLGVSQMYSTGSYHRSRYIEEYASHKILGISSDEYRPSQLWASAPDQSILLHTATTFLQGLYPPLGDINVEAGIDLLANGSASAAPLNGYQYIHVHGESEDEPDTMWLKGDEACPAYASASKSYETSEEYVALLESSRDFYTQFAPLLTNILPPENVSYVEAFDVFDLLNVASIHNRSVSEVLTTEKLNRLRYYADAHEYASNFNASQPKRAIGGMTLAGGILRQLNQTISGQGKLKFSLLAGSYDTFLSFFGITNLTSLNPDFTGLPNYASSMALELFTPETTDTFPSSQSELRVRFLFRNGTEAGAEMTAFPLFGREEQSVGYEEFVDIMGKRAIRSPATWCQVCESEEGFCSQKEIASTGQDSSQELTLVEAGVIGAMTTLGVCLIIGMLIFLFFRKRWRSRPIPSIGPSPTKSLSGSESSISAKYTA